MKKTFFLLFFCAVLTVTCVFCGAASMIDPVNNRNKTEQTAVQTADEAESPSSAAEPSESEGGELNVTAGEAAVISLSSKENSELESFSSSDKSVVTVDSGGRIDALKQGEATVTALFKDKSKKTFAVTVSKASDTSAKSYSTCTTANYDVLKSNIKSSKKNGRYLYRIKVNRAANCVTVYTYDKSGKYTVPVRAMVCSTGLNDSTITGTYSIGVKSKWLSLVGGVYGRYISGISGDYLFHSVPYYTKSNDDLEVEEFNKLGSQASRGCVRLSVSDAKWIYSSCKVGTEVEIYDDADNPGPLGKPDVIKITDASNKWDPTDTDKESSYAEAMPTIKGAKNSTLKLGADYSALSGVTALDTCSNDITDRIKTVGNVVTSRRGTYKVTYSVTDTLKRTASVTVTVTVK